MISGSWTKCGALASALALVACGGATTHSADQGNARDHRAMAEQEESLSHQHRVTGGSETAGESPSIDMSRADDHASEV